MSIFDFYNNYVDSKTAGPTSSATGSEVVVNFTAIDGKNAVGNKVAHVVSFMTAANGAGAGYEDQALAGNEMWKVILQESADNSTFTDVTDQAYAYPTFVTASDGVMYEINTNAKGCLSYVINYSGPYRYSRIVLEPTGSETAIKYAGIGLYLKAGAASGSDIGIL